MPATAKQKRLFAADLQRLEKGTPTVTGMTHDQLMELMHSPTRTKVPRARAKQRPPAPRPSRQGAKKRGRRRSDNPGNPLLLGYTVVK